MLDELTQQVPTAGFILDVSRLDEAMLNDDVETLEVLRSRTPGKHSEDALIAATAQFHGAALVTNDHRLTGRARECGIEVLTSGELLTELRNPGVPPAATASSDQ